jgi:hypothetical protein
MAAQAVCFKWTVGERGRPQLMMSEERVQQQCTSAKHAKNEAAGKIKGRDECKEY